MPSYERPYPCHDNQRNVSVEFSVLRQYKSPSHLILICMLQTERLAVLE